MRKIWYEDRLGNLSSYRNLRDNYKEIVPEILEFVKENEYLMDEWIMDKWVDDSNQDEYNYGMVRGVSSHFLSML